MAKMLKIKYYEEYVYVNPDNMNHIGATNYWSYGDGGLILRDALSHKHQHSWSAIREWIETDEAQEKIVEAMLINNTEEEEVDE